jgi:hypothetical protein
MIRSLENFVHFVWSYAIAGSMISKSGLNRQCSKQAIVTWGPDRERTMDDTELPSKNSAGSSLFMKVTLLSTFLCQLLKPYRKNAVSWDSSVGVANVYGLDGRVVGVRVPVDVRIFSTPRHPDRFWGPPILLAIGYQR